MTIAEIHGKISDAGSNLSERMEDLLTSDIFGCMRYLPADKALLPLLNTARSFHGKSFNIQDKVIKTHYSFWPGLKSPGSFWPGCTSSARRLPRSAGATSTGKRCCFPIRQRVWLSLSGTRRSWWQCSTRRFREGPNGRWT